MNDNTRRHRLGDVPDEERVRTAIVHGRSPATGRPPAGLSDQPAWQTSLVNPDFAEFANDIGAVVIPVRSADELDEAAAQLFAVDGWAVLPVHPDAELG